MTTTEGVLFTGWGVVRVKPWHFVGLLPTKELAQAKAAEMGAGYEVHHGEHREGSDAFTWKAGSPNWGHIGRWRPRR